MSTQTRLERKAVDEAADVASSIGGRLADKIGNGIDEAAKSAGRIGERLRSNGAQLQEELIEAGDRFGEGAKRLGSVASEQIRAHPWAALGIAAAVGFVASRVLRRR
jgi:ElaB/YqjD/DUF883 family membrane-anchored ribosome-binding protein